MRRIFSPRPLFLSWEKAGHANAEKDRDLPKGNNCKDMAVATNRFGDFLSENLEMVGSLLDISTCSD